MGVSLVAFHIPSEPGSPGSNDVSSSAIVESLDIIEHSQPGLGTGFICLVVNPFRLKAVEKTFCNGIVPAASFATHASDDAVLF